MRRLRSMPGFAPLLFLLALALLAACTPEKVAGPGVTVKLYASPEKKRVLDDLLARYKLTNPTVDGLPVSIETTYMESGDILDAIRDGQQPTAISPASSTWVTQLSASWRQQSPGAEDIVATSRPLWVSPLVVGMWEPMAQAMGAIGHPVSWRTFISATLDTRGWAAYNHAEWGQFKFAHAGPDTDSGRLALMAIFYAGSGKVRDLNVNDMKDPHVIEYVRNIERGITQYGESDSAIADQMRKNGLTYISAAVMEEATMIAFNTATPRPPAKLVGLYPIEGTFWADHPYVTLNAPWVSAQEETASRNLLNYLLSDQAQKVALANGFRPSNLSLSLDGSPVSLANGADPKQPETLLAIPGPDVLDAVRNAWTLTKKPANIILVADVSGSMQDEHKLENAQAGLADFISSVTESDKLGLVVFDDTVRTTVRLAQFNQNQRTTIQQAINDLTPGGKTALFRAARAAVDQLVQLNDRQSINAVVLMTDGQDTLNERNAKQNLLTYLQSMAKNGQSGRGPVIKVFTVAYGSDADQDTLRQIAEATGGVAVEGTPATIRKLYRLLSSYF